MSRMLKEKITISTDEMKQDVLRRVCLFFDTTLNLLDLQQIYSCKLDCFFQGVMTSTCTRGMYQII